jgi:hypothetical protein
VKIPLKLRSKPVDELLAWYNERLRKEAERKRRERACDRCGRQQLHWDRLQHPRLGGGIRMYLVNRKGKIHECKSKFRIRSIKK